MTRKILPLMAAALLIFGCSRSGKMQRDQQQYQTVQEGTASGVTSTINAPGETPAPLTDTNADTTTNFTLPTNPNPMGDTAGTTMTGSPAPMTSTTFPRPPRPRVSTPSRPQELQPEPATDTSDTTSMDTSPVPTTTTDTRRPPKTTTSPDVKKKPDEEPPPPPTDTTGTQG